MEDLLLWQLVDSAFPTGAFAHSGGLEAAHQLGRVRDAGDLAAFAAEAVRNAARAGLPFVTAAHAAPGRLAEVDAAFDAFATGQVANRASRAQGRALLRASEAAFPVEVAPVASAAGVAGFCGHLAPIHGAVLAALGATPGACQRLYLFTVVRGILGAAVRLGLVGPLEAQALLARTAPAVAEAVRACGAIALEDAAAETPLVELFQAHHDRLYSRLFQS